MEFESKVDREIRRLHSRLAELEKAQQNEASDKLASLKKKGWGEIKFFSQYTGSHQELGEGDIEQRIAIRPGIAIPEWSGRFGHGHRSENPANRELEEFLEGLDDRDYIIFENDDLA